MVLLIRHIRDLPFLSMLAAPYGRGHAPASAFASSSALTTRPLSAKPAI
jgi:hypothetical protein